MKPFLQRPPRSWREVCLRHAETWPASEAIDYYKLLFQGTFGPGHLIAEFEQTRRFLEREWTALPKVKEAGRPIEPIAPFAAVVRVHLAAFSPDQRSIDLLVTALRASAAEIQGDQKAFAQRWRSFRKALPARVRFDAIELDRVWSTMEAANWPQPRHSGRYRETYAPAYRVLSLNQAEWFLTAAR